MKHGLENKIILQILSVGIAIVLWFIITYTENPSINITVNNITVEYAGVSALEKQKLTMVYPEKTESVSVVLKGTRSDLFNTIDNVRAVADVSSITAEGDYSIPITFSVPLSSVEIAKAKVSSVDVSVEPLISKDVPVIVNQTGSNKEYVVKSTPSNDYIKITGAASYINKVAYAKVSVDISNITEKEISGYSYSFVDSSESDISVSRNVESDSNGVVITNEVLPAKTVPVEISYPENITNDYTVNIKSVSSQYVVVGIPDELYDSVTSVSAQFPETVTAGTAVELTLPLSVPDGVYSKESSVTVKADISLKQTKTFSLPVTYKNIPDGMSVVPPSQNVTVSAKGDADKLDASLMTASADLSGLSAGTYNVTLDITTPGGVLVEPVYSVIVTIQ